MDNLGSQVNPVVQVLFPNNDATFQDASPIHTARSVQSWFEEHEDALQHLLWLAQSPTLNIIKPLWSVLETRVRSRYPLTSSLKQLEEELAQYSTRDSSDVSLFQEVYNLCYGQMVAQLHIKKKCVPFTTVCIVCPSPVNATKLYSLG
jgi:hypothetical protein